MLQKRMMLVFILLIFGGMACATPPPPAQDAKAGQAETDQVEADQIETDQAEADQIEADQIEADPLAQGKRIYDENCASCHGFDGEGQPNWREPNDKGVYPAPPHDNSGHTWHHPDAQLLQIIAQGGSLPTSGMTGFADKLTEEEMILSLDYIKTFWGEEERAIQAERSR